ncbi:MAG: acetylglutamate kinase [Clostridia bacterium]
METISNETKAKILVDALPYMQEYYNKIIVVKYGGNAMINEELRNAVMCDVVLLSLVGIKVVLVHGGGPEINEALEMIGHKSYFVNGLRYTDKITADVVQMVLAGKVNKKLVSLLQNNGGKALGLCGIDADMIKVKKMEGEVDLGFVGEITSINTKPILDALNNGYIPVIATVGCGENSQPYNINADTAAASIASALKAENLILLSDIKGLLEDKNNEETLLPVVKIDQIEALTKNGVISGGMIPKVACCKKCLQNGVSKVFIIDGRQKHSIIIELFTNQGIGTMFI